MADKTKHQWEGILASGFLGKSPSIVGHLNNRGGVISIENSIYTLSLILPGKKDTYCILSVKRLLQHIGIKKRLVSICRDTRFKQSDTGTCCIYRNLHILSRPIGRSTARILILSITTAHHTQTSCYHTNTSFSSADSAHGSCDISLSPHCRRASSRELK